MDDSSDRQGPLSYTLSQQNLTFLQRFGASPQQQATGFLVDFRPDGMETAHVAVRAYAKRKEWHGADREQRRQIIASVINPSFQGSAALQPGFALQSTEAEKKSEFDPNNWSMPLSDQLLREQFPGAIGTALHESTHSEQYSTMLQLAQGGGAHHLPLHGQRQLQALHPQALTHVQQNPVNLDPQQQARANTLADSFYGANAQERNQTIQDLLGAKKAYDENRASLDLALKARTEILRKIEVLKQAKQAQNGIATDQQKQNYQALRQDLNEQVARFDLLNAGRDEINDTLLRFNERYRSLPEEVEAFAAQEAFHKRVKEFEAGGILSVMEIDAYIEFSASEQRLDAQTRTHVIEGMLDMAEWTTPMRDLLEMTAEQQAAFDIERALAFWVGFSVLLQTGKVREPYEYHFISQGPGSVLLVVAPPGLEALSEDQLFEHAYLSTPIKAAQGYLFLG